MAYVSSNPPVKEINILSVQGCVQRMWHNACFLVILNGEVQVRVDGHATYLNDNGLMLVEPDTPFEVTGHGSNLLMIIRMDYDFFIQSRAGRFGRLVCNSAEDDQRDYTLLRQMLSHLALNYYEDIEYKELRQLELCYSLLYYLNTIHYVPGVSALTGTGEGEMRGRQIISYIESNYMQDIRLDDLSEATFLSASYLSRLFKKLTGTNFKSYLEEVRLRHAVEDMRGTDQTITTIAYNNGFPNVSALSNAIRKKYDMSPNEFRRSLVARGDDVVEQPPYNEVDYDQIKENLAMIVGSEPVKSLGMYRFPDQMEYVVEDVTKFQPIQPIWKQMINIGALANLSHVNTKSHLILLQEEIGFKYARIESVLTDDSMPMLPNGQYNFSQFDRAIELLLSLKLTPFLDLSFKGDYVLQTRSETLYRGDRPRQMSSEREFVEKVSALIRHCINTFGAGEVERWGVEICALHDETLNFVETPAEYATRFREVYGMIKSWLPNMQIGGPEHHIAVDNDFLRDAAALLRKWGVKPDFLSLCAVPYEATQGADRSIPFVLSSRADYIRERVQNIKDMLWEEFRNDDIPIWITAFSSDIRTRNHVNDSAYQATFTIKNTLDLVGLVDVIGYWQLSDVDSEYIDTTRILFGGTGIISKDGLKKPGFSALKRLGGINTLMVSKEGNMMVTTNAINTYNIVLYNYAHFTDLYCLSSGEGVTYDNAYTVFGDAATKDIRIKLNGLQEGRYKVITTTLNRENGSLFDEWLRYGIIDELQPHDIRYLQDIVHPQRTVRYQSCEDGMLELSLQMLPHEVKFLLILREL
jgi:beta-xylosidase/AraC-like DNA-binding protein